MLKYVYFNMLCMLLQFFEKSIDTIYEKQQ